MTVQPQRGHYYERRDKRIVGPAMRRKAVIASENPYVWRIGTQLYNVRGEYSAAYKYESHFDLMKDLGTTDPRPEKPPRKPTRPTLQKRLDAMTKRAEAAEAMAESAMDMLRDFAEYECEYGDHCPAFGSRHGQCVGCQARKALQVK